MLDRLTKRSVASCLLIALLLSLLPFTTASADGITDDIANPGFESTPTSGSIPGWSSFSASGTLTVTSEQKYEQNFSLKLIDSSSTTSAGAISDSIKAVPGESLTASAYVFRNSGANAGIYLRYYNASGTFLSQDYYIPPSLPLQTWTSISASGIVPAGATNARILIYSTNVDVATTYIDSVVLTRNFINNSFEDPVSSGIIPGWSQTIGTGNIAVSSEKARTGTKSLKITDTSATGAYGLESQKMSVIAGESYKASAYVYHSSGSAHLYLRFYDSANTLVGNFFRSASAQNAWTPVSIVETAPAGAVTVSVLLYSSQGNQMTAYFDDIEIRTALTNLGTQVTGVSVNMGAIGKDSAGNDLLYTAVQGKPAMFTVIDIKTATILKTIPLPGSIVAWAFAVATDGTVYIGTTSNGHLMTYTPGSNTVTDLGQAIAGETSIWDLEWVPSLNQIYGGTADHNKLFKYTTSGGFVDLGSMVAGESHVRSLAFNAATGLLYAGVGSNAHLIEYNRSTGTKTNILPAAYADQNFVYDLDLVNGKLILRMDPDPNIVVMDPTTRAVIKAFPGNSRGVSPLSPIDDKFYYTYSNILYSYDFSSNSTTNLNVNLQGAALNYAFVQLNQSNFPGYTMVGLAGNGGKMYKYNLSTGYTEIVTLPLPAQPIDIFEIGKGSDGNIYSSGFVSGGTGVYNPTNGSIVTYKGIGQAESMAALGSNMYFGKYPDAVIFKYNPSNPWDTSAGNPIEVFRLSSSQQDRPLAMTGLPSANKLYVGTAPDYGTLGGALTVYDQVANTYTSTRNILNQQSVTSLAILNNELFGGGSIYGGIGSTPTETQAKMFIYNTTTGTKVTELVPVTGKKLITGLIAGPDGNIWGFADGTLFTLSPTTRTITYTSNLFPSFSNRLYGAVMEIGNDGWVYGTIGGTLFKLHPTTKVMTVMRNKGDANRLAKDNQGNFYFENGSNLFKFEAY